MAAYEYKRKEYQENLLRIRQIATYQDYENAMYEMNELKNDIKKNMEHIPNVDAIVALMDQVDNVYYGDIGFHTDMLLDKFAIHFVAGAIVAALREQGEDCYEYSLYYNEELQMFLYTRVVIEADDGPDLYAQGTNQFSIIKENHYVQ